MNVSIPKGTRDFSPEEMVRRTYIFDRIKTVFKLFSYQCIETPAMENLSTLMGKYGEEGDKLLFKVLNSGNFLEGVSASQLTDALTATRAISEKGLRYDLTVPFARYVVQHRNEIVLPFKRFQIQPVWRADRPQKGRYREFYQCDADVVGSESLINEAELLQMIDQVFEQFGLDVLIKLNNRKILSGIAEIMGQADKIVDITVAIDKIDKIGLQAVQTELYSKGITDAQFALLAPILTLAGTNLEKLNQLDQILQTSEIGKLGISEIRTLLAYVSNLGVNKTIELDLSLARGLHYYTGAIFEVKAIGVEMGSICGGGRYDNLTGIFGLKNVSGVGISFGADRIYDVLLSLDKFPKTGLETSKVLFTNMGPSEEEYCLQALSRIRKLGIASEIYPDQVKLKKQLDYANKRNIPFVVVVGASEVNNNSYLLKNMQSGEQKECIFEELVSNLLDNN